MEQYTEAEIRWAMQRHDIIASETRNGTVFQRHIETVPACVADPRELGMPQHLFESLIDRRMAKLGPQRLAEFRARARNREAAPPAPAPETATTTRLF